MERFEPTITCQAELCAAWERLMGPHGFAGRSLWLMLLLPGGIPVPTLTEIEEVPEVPDDRVLGSLMEICEDLIDADGMSIAFLLSRPGTDGLSAADRRWGRSLVVAARRAGVPMLPVHRANDAGVLPLAPDDLAVSGAA